MNNIHKISKKKIYNIKYITLLKNIILLKNINNKKQTNKQIKKIVKKPQNIKIKSFKNALLIGCNYKNTQYELFGCINDVNNIKNKIQKEYKFNNITILTDNTTKKPTKINILNSLKNLLINSKSGDTLLFFYSGHGTQTIDKNNEETDKLDEVIVPLDFKYIIDDELNNIIYNNLKSGVNLFTLFDCCHSGSILDLKYQYIDSTNLNNITINNKYKNIKGNVLMISGCMDKQTSADAFINNKFQGAMTWSFLKSINSNKNIKWFDLVQNMRNLLKSNGYNQIPQLSSGNELTNSTLFL
jgi:hypothetical protein